VLEIERQVELFAQKGPELHAPSVEQDEEERLRGREAVYLCVRP
jgi:hypothetical protein